MSATPATIDRPAPLVGQHSAEILREFGVSDTAVADLAERRVIEQAVVPDKPSR
jgi:crotonobetainyl-CoA:carnitine CoA-transferase CaiB-like acyl-CoA transferase